jgi:hypothetical protein
VKRAAVALVLAVVAGSGLTACEPNTLGAAAVVGNHRITVTEIQNTLAGVREQRAAAGLPADPGADAARTEVLRQVLDLVFEQAAKNLGLAITAADVQATRDADERSDAELGGLATESNVNLEDLAELFRRFTLEQKISDALEKKFPGAEQQQLDAEYEKLLIATAQSMDIRVNPRYGTFDPVHGQIAPTQFDFLRPPKK